MKTGGIGASLSAIINESLWDELDHQVLVKRSSNKPLPCPVQPQVTTATAGQDKGEDIAAGSYAVLSAWT